MTEITPPPSRNDLCPCHSGKRYKHCHGAVALASQAPVETEPNADHLAIVGLQAQQRGDLTLAERYYRQSLGLNPENADAMHMLGVVRMQQFDYQEARQLIERAGAMTKWQFASFRHNYAHLLSAFIGGRQSSARVAAKAQAPTKAVSASHHDVRWGLVLVLDADVSRTELAAVSAELSETSVTAGAIAILGSFDADLASGLALSTWMVPTFAGAVNRMAAAGVETVVIAPRLCAPNEAAAAAIKRFMHDGAQWGLLAADLLATKENEAVARVHRTALRRLAHIDELGSALFADDQLRTLLCVTAWKFDFLSACSKGSVIENIFDLFLAALWKSEPIHISETSLAFASALNDQWWQRQFAPIEGYVRRALTHEMPDNQLAPCAAIDGLGFLKRPLRIWIGAHLSAETLGHIAAAVDARTKPSTIRNDGVEFIGFARAESGLGESMRLLVRAARTENLTCAVADVALDVGMRQADESVVDLIVDTPTFRTRVVCVNPDSLGEALHLDGVGAVIDCRQIGYWYWELERIPQRWVDATRLVDEVWVASDFVAGAVTSSASIPVRVITPPLLTPQLSRPYSRAEFNLPDDACVFLFSFAYGSFATRKNPEAVIRAFRTAFPLSIRDARLVVKTSQSELFQTQVEALMSEAKSDSRIIFVNSYLSRDQLTGLQSVCDCYVSLHRSEGLGLGMAEAMSLGKPTIGTGYSGNLAFMNEHNSLLVDFSRVAIRAGDYPDANGQSWADANVEDAARKMRFVYDNRAEAAALGEVARNDLAQRFSLAAVGARIRKALSM